MCLGFVRTQSERGSSVYCIQSERHCQIERTQQEGRWKSERRPYNSSIALPQLNTGIGEPFQSLRIEQASSEQTLSQISSASKAAARLVVVGEIHKKSLVNDKHSYVYRLQVGSPHATRE